MDNQPDNQAVPVPPHTQSTSVLRSGRATLREAWSIYRQRLATFLGITLIPTLIMFIWSISLGYLQSADRPNFSTAGSALLVLLIFLFLIVILVIQAWGQVALLYAIMDSGGNIGVLESYRRGWHKIASYWWVATLTIFIILGGFILLIVPGIIFATWFAFALFILVDENLKGVNALLKSKEYVKGKWGGVFWRLFFIGIIFFLIGLAVGMIIGISKVPFGTEIGKFISGLILTPIAVIYSFLLYKNLKASKGDVMFTPTRKQKATFISIGILPLLVIPAIFILIFSFAFGSARIKSRDAVRSADIHLIQAGLELYYTDNKSYPSSLDLLSPKYLQSRNLADPSTNQPYQYTQEQNGANYKLCADLEVTKTQTCLSAPQ